MRSLASVIMPVVFAIGAQPKAVAQTTVHEPPAGMTCSGDRLVWVNTRSGIYHFQGERYFGTTNQGMFMCHHDADLEGDRPARNGQ